jgi:hypothetical protein
MITVKCHFSSQISLLVYVRYGWRFNSLHVNSYLLIKSKRETSKHTIGGLYNFYKIVVIVSARTKRSSPGPETLSNDEFTLDLIVVGDFCSKGNNTPRSKRQEMFFSYLRNGWRLSSPLMSVFTWTSHLSIMASFTVSVSFQDVSFSERIIHSCGPLRFPILVK